MLTSQEHFEVLKVSHSASSMPSLNSSVPCRSLGFSFALIRLYEVVAGTTFTVEAPPVILLLIGRHKRYYHSP